MPLSNYLRGIPAANQQAALCAAASSIYRQHLRLLRDAAQLKSPKELASAYEEIKFLVQDAQEIRDLNVLSGHAKHMIDKVADLNLDTVLASLRFQVRHPTKPL
jgi:hypothetical protein